MLIVADETTILEKRTYGKISLALGIIAGYLKTQGKTYSLYDLDLVFKDRIFTEEEKKKISLIYQGDRVINYLLGKEDKDFDQLASFFLRDFTFDSRAYGVSLGADFSLFQIHQGLILAKYIQKETGKKVIVGGNNVDYLYIYKDFYKDLLIAMVKGLDYVLRGPGEITICQIINQENIDRKILPGLIRLSEERIINNPQQQATITRPDWGNLDLEAYKYPLSTDKKENEKLLYSLPNTVAEMIFPYQNEKVKEKTLFIPYIFNYNCSYRCAFCTQSAEERGAVLVGQVDKVVDDLAYLTKKYKSNYFYFLNNYFPSSLTYIKSFKEALEERNLKIYWSDCGRVNGMTREKLEMMYQAGCRKLIFGFETGDDGLLTYVNKQLDLKELSKIIKACYDIGIYCDIEVIIGLPYEGQKEFENTKQFIEDHKKELNNFWLNEFFLIPNSLLGTYPERYKIKILKNLYNYEKLCHYNKQEFLGDKQTEMTSNSRLWGFNEIKDDWHRNFQEIQRENANKMKILEKRRNPEFAQLYQFYKMIDSIRKEG